MLDLVSIKLVSELRYQPWVVAILIEKEVQIEYQGPVY